MQFEDLSLNLDEERLRELAMAAIASGGIESFFNIPPREYFSVILPQEVEEETAEAKAIRLLSQEISALELKVSSFNALRRYGIEYIWQFLEIAPLDMGNISGFGVIGLRDTRQCIQEMFGIPLDELRIKSEWIEQAKTLCTEAVSA